MANNTLPQWMEPTRRTNGDPVEIELEQFHKQKTFRHPFDRDYGIICHSSKFRRLTGKTQVFVHPKNDYPRTRLTHSIEVAQLGRELATIFRHMFEQRFAHFTLGPAGTFERLVETACLAHDLGHPPFGHAGAKVLEEFCDFDDNKHTVRYFVRGEDSLQVTNVLLDAILKYKPLRKAWYPEDDKRCLDLIAPLKTEYYRHPTTYLMEIADDLVNFTSDLEDATHLGLLNKKDCEYFYGFCDVSNFTDTLSDYKENAKVISSKILKNLIGSHVKTNLSEILSKIDPNSIGTSAEHFPKLFDEALKEVSSLNHDWDKLDKDCLNMLSAIKIRDQTLLRTVKTLYFNKKNDPNAPKGILTKPEIQNPEQHAKEILREIWGKLEDLARPENHATFKYKASYLVLPESLQSLFDRFFKCELDRNVLYAELAHYLAGMTEKYCVSVHKKLMKTSTELFEEAIEI